MQTLLQPGKETSETLYNKWKNDEKALSIFQQLGIFEPGVTGGRFTNKVQFSITDKTLSGSPHDLLTSMAIPQGNKPCWTEIFTFSRSLPLHYVNTEYLILQARRLAAIEGLQRDYMWLNVDRDYKMLASLMREYGRDYQYDIHSVTEAVVENMIQGTTDRYMWNKLCAITLIFLTGYHRYKWWRTNDRAITQYRCGVLADYYRRELDAVEANQIILSKIMPFGDRVVVYKLTPRELKVILTMVDRAEGLVTKEKCGITLSMQSVGEDDQFDTLNDYPAAETDIGTLVYYMCRNGYTEITQRDNQHMLIKNNIMSCVITNDGKRNYAHLNGRLTDNNHSIGVWTKLNLNQYCTNPDEVFLQDELVKSINGCGTPVLLGASTKFEIQKII
jgi:hypothetical protein